MYIMIFISRRSFFDNNFYAGMLKWSGVTSSYVTLLYVINLLQSSSLKNFHVTSPSKHLHLWTDLIPSARTEISPTKTKNIKRQSRCVFFLLPKKANIRIANTHAIWRRTGERTPEWINEQHVVRLTDGELYVVERAPMFKWRVKSKPGRLPTPSKLSGLVRVVPPARTAAIGAPRSSSKPRRPHTHTLT